MSSVPEDPSAFVAPSRERIPATSAMAVGPRPASSRSPTASTPSR
ncbi:hypothetical protein OIM90_21450 [Streptomyces sp. AD16]|nr:hypothetical protein NQP46_10930 [Streptomyces albus]WDV32957.1 hypothetical protein OIM90_21450 [Streptomyces sp. AD16]